MADWPPRWGIATPRAQPSRLEGLIALRLLACLAALLGGLVLAGRWFLDGEPGIVLWIGLGLVTLALAVAGAGLVKKGAGWLRLVVAVALPALVLSLYSAVRAGDPDLVDPELVDLVAGVFAALLGSAFLVRTPRRPRRQGAHAR